MKIESIRIEAPGYKRFNDLALSDIPESARVVVLIGPNGSGKSSLFDAFLLKSWSARGNQRISGNNDYGGYYSRSSDDGAQTTHEIAQRIEVKFHSRDRTLMLRINGLLLSTYGLLTEMSPDFRLDAIQAVGSAHASERFRRIIDADQAVSENYRRLAWRRQADIDRDAPEGNDHRTVSQRICHGPPNGDGRFVY